MTSEQVTQAEMVERCRLLSEDEKSFITNQAQFMRALIGQWEMVKSQIVTLAPKDTNPADIFMSSLGDIIENYDQVLETVNGDMERAAFLTIERVRRQLIIGMTDAKNQQAIPLVGKKGEQNGEINN